GYDHHRVGKALPQPEEALDRQLEVVENESRKCDHGDAERQADFRSACRLVELGDLVHSRAVCDHFDPLCGYAEGDRAIPQRGADGDHGVAAETEAFLEERLDRLEQTVQEAVGAIRYGPATSPPVPPIAHPAAGVMALQ